MIDKSQLSTGERYGYSLYHLSPMIGTEIRGINLGDKLADEVIVWLSDLLVDRKVIFFRDQTISVKQHVEFARRFGDIEIHPFTNNDDTYPEVIRLDNDKARPPRINQWHSDVTWRQNPSLGSILRGVEIPEVGGDTLFANMESAYEVLDDETKEFLDGLYAIHDNEVFLQGMKQRGAGEDEIDAMRKKFPPVKHPVVRTHPVSQRKSVYVNSTFTRCIDGMDTEVSDKLLQKLYLTAWNPDHQCRFRWQKDSFTFWDNRSVQHFAAADYWPNVRKMERVTVVGDRPV